MGEGRREDPGMEARESRNFFLRFTDWGGGLAQDCLNDTYLVEGGDDFDAPSPGCQALQTGAAGTTQNSIFMQGWQGLTIRKGGMNPLFGVNLPMCVAATARVPPCRD